MNNKIESLGNGDFKVAPLDDPAFLEFVKKRNDAFANRPWVVEKHGDGYAIYRGRDAFHHGWNMAHLTEVTEQTVKLIEDALNFYELRVGNMPTLN